MPDDRRGNLDGKHEGKQWKNNLYNFHFDKINIKDEGPAFHGERYLRLANMALC